MALSIVITPVFIFLSKSDILSINSTYLIGCNFFYVIHMKIN